jgi:hypothetical protein
LSVLWYCTWLCPSPYMGFLNYSLLTMAWQKRLSFSLVLREFPASLGPFTGASTGMVMKSTSPLYPSCAEGDLKLWAQQKLPPNPTTQTLLRGHLVGWPRGTLKIVQQDSPAPPSPLLRASSLLTIPALHPTHAAKQKPKFPTEYGSPPTHRIVHIDRYPWTKFKYNDIRT